MDPEQLKQILVNAMAQQRSGSATTDEEREAVRRRLAQMYGLRPEEADILVDRVYRLQARPPDPPDRVYRLQARPPESPEYSEPPTIMIPGVGPVVPRQYQIPEHERPPREVVMQLPRKNPSHERLPREMVIQLPRSGR